MRDRFHATSPRAQQLRFHAQTAGSTLTAQQPDNNIVRVALCRRSPPCSAARSRFIATARDEALALPTEESARLALRTQQIIAAESGVANTVDPVAGSYAIEAATTDIERGARELLDRIERAGGTLAAIETGLIQREIQEAAYRAQLAVESGEAVVVGVNRFVGAAGVRPGAHPAAAARSGRRAPPDRTPPGRAGEPQRRVVSGHRSTRCRARRATATTSCRRSSRRWRPGSPSAKSRTLCARCSVNSRRRIRGETRRAACSRRLHVMAVFVSSRPISAGRTGRTGWVPGANMTPLLSVAHLTTVFDLRWRTGGGGGRCQLRDPRR